MATTLTDNPGTIFEPDVHTRDALVDRLASPQPKIRLGPKRGYDVKGGAGTPHEVVFVLATSGSPSRPIRGGPDERHPSIQVWIRSKPASAKRSFQDGQALARAVHDALDQRPFTGYCEVRSFNSQPMYIGQDTDGHHEWSINFELTVDVTVA